MLTSEKRKVSFTVMPHNLFEGDILHKLYFVSLLMVTSAEILSKEVDNFCFETPLTKTSLFYLYFIPILLLSYLF